MLLCGWRENQNSLSAVIQIPYISTRSLGSLRALTSSWRPFGSALAPSGLLDFVIHALLAFMPCDPRNDALCIRTWLHRTFVHGCIIHSYMDASYDDYHLYAHICDVLSLSTYLQHVKIFFCSFLFCTGYIHENNCVHNNPVELVDYHLKYLGARF